MRKHNQSKNYFISVDNAYPNRSKTKKKKMLQKFSYILDRVALSIDCGNTNHIGRDTWYNFMKFLQNGVSDYVNECKDQYRQSKQYYNIRVKIFLGSCNHTKVPLNTDRRIHVCVCVNTHPTLQCL